MEAARGPGPSGGPKAVRPEEKGVKKGKDTEWQKVRNEKSPKNDMQVHMVRGGGVIWTSRLIIGPNSGPQ